MEIEKINDFNYLTEISKNFKLLQEATINDPGVIFRRMKDWGIHIEKELLYQLNTAMADFFLIENYDLTKSEILDILKKENIVAKVDFYSSILGADYHRYKFLNNSYYEVNHRLPFNISLENHPHLKEQEQLLKTFEFLFLRAELFGNPSGVNSFDSVEKTSIFDVTFNRETFGVLKEMFSYKSVRDLFRNSLKNTSIGSFKIDFHVLEALWENDFKIEDMSFLSVPDFDSSEIINQNNNLINLIKKYQSEATINSVFKHLPFSLKIGNAKFDLTPDFSNKSLDFFLGESIMKLKFASNLLEGVVKSERFNLIDDLIKMSSLFASFNYKEKISDEDKEKHKEDLFVLIKKISPALKPGYFDNMHSDTLELIVGLLPEYEMALKSLNLSFKEKESIEPFFNKFKTTILDIPAIHFKKIADVTDLKQFLNIGEDSLNKLFILNKGKINTLNSDLDNIEMELFERLLKRKPEIITDFMMVVEGRTIPFTSSIFNDPSLNLRNGNINKDVFSLFNYDMKKEAVKLFDLGLFDNDSNLTVNNIYALSLDEMHRYFYSERKNKDNSSLSRKEQLFLAYVADFNVEIEPNVTYFNEAVLKDILNLSHLLENEPGTLNFDESNHIKNKKKEYSMRLRDSKSLASLSLLKKFNNSDEIERIFKSCHVTSFKQVLLLNSLWKDRFNNNDYLEDFLLNKLRNKDIDDVPCEEFLKIISKHLFHVNALNYDELQPSKITKDDVFLAFKAAFKSSYDVENVYIYKSFLKNNVNFLNFEKLFLGDVEYIEKAKNHLIENAPVVVMNGNYTLTQKMREEMSLLEYTQMAKTLINDIGFSFINVMESTNWLVVEDFIEKSTEKEYWEAIDFIKKDCPSFYSFVFNEKSLYKLIEGGSMKDSFNEWADKYKKSHSDEELEDSDKLKQRFIMDLIDWEALAHCYIDIKDKNYQAFAKHQKAGKTLIHNGLNVFGAFSLFPDLEKSKEDNIKIEGFFTKLLENDIGFLPILSLLKDVEKCISGDFLVRKVLDNVHSFEDVYKLFSFTSCSDVRDENTLKNIHMFPKDIKENWIYPVVLKKLIMKKPDCAKIVEFFYENMIAPDNSLVLVNVKNKGDLLKSAPSYVKMINHFNLMGFDFLNMAKIIGRYEQINKNLNDMEINLNAPDNDSFKL